MRGKRERRDGPPGTARRFRVVLFDVHGTLIEDQDFDRYGEIAAEEGIAAHPEAIAEAVRWANNELRTGDPVGSPDGYWHRVLVRASGRDVDASAAHRFADRLARLPRRAHLFSDVRRTLDRLRAEGRTLGVVSNAGSEGALLELLESVGILDFFSTIVTSDRTGFVKPDPEIFRRAAREAGVEPSEAFYVGDLPEVDARAAASAGLGAVWLHRDGTGFGEEPPEITSLTELPKWIRNAETYEQGRPAVRSSS